MSHLLEPELTAILFDMKAQDWRPAAFRIAGEAIRYTNVDSPLVISALKNTPPADLEADPETKTALEQHAAQIEEPYLEALGRDETIEDHPPLDHLFRQARAVSSLAAAFDENAYSGIEDTIYEALHAGVAIKDVRKILLGFDKLRQPPGQQ